MGARENEWIRDSVQSKRLEESELVEGREGGVEAELLIKYNILLLK